MVLREDRIDILDKVYFATGRARIEKRSNRLLNQIARVLREHPRLRLERFPSYAPELNPDEGVWNLAKHDLANGCPKDLDDLMEDLVRSIERTRASSKQLRGCVLQSDLPPFLR